MKLAKWLLSLVTENFGWKLLSLAIAVVVWAAVSNEPELLTQVRVGVEYKDVEQGLEISSDLVNTVNLELSGPSGLLRGLNDPSSRPDVILDLGRMGAGQRTFAIGDGNVRLPRGVRLVRATPAKVTVTVTKRKI